MKPNSLGNYGFILSLFPIVHILLSPLILAGVVSNLIFTLIQFVFIVLAPITAVILCLIQIKNNRTNLAIWGLVLAILGSIYGLWLLFREIYFIKQYGGEYLERSTKRFAV